MSDVPNESPVRGAVTVTVERCSFGAPGISSQHLGACTSENCYPRHASECGRCLRQDFCETGQQWVVTEDDPATTYLLDVKNRIMGVD